MAKQLYNDLVIEFSTMTIKDYCERSGVEFNLKNPSLLQIQDAIISDFNKKLEENGEEEVISVLNYMILNFHEFKSNVDEIDADSDFFLNEIDPSVLIVDGVKVGDKLKLVKFNCVMIVEILGFTDINIPIVEYIEVDYFNEPTNEDNDRFCVGDILPYPYNNFASKKI